uniref:Ycf55 n=2 Tax=Gracilariopsis TaxID=2781 RepID=A0A1C9CF31_9FLOR|nr:Ycf55 [Gracilariopsis lemaneiformis]YP_009294717.1 hypothetical protein Gch_118 [Gracilariopsis chorda]AJO68363.1 hypothetical protein [Gracilariopsis lemaneiformis]AML79961.1 Ycf55 [Gracilariopsis lemaneiformis]AOM66977.1 hypothetical protein Gch_118 [Gracilariopsis chorda]
MVKYWPCKQGMYLNHEVAHLFAYVKQKFNGDLSNRTNDNLYIDILNNSVKYRLFSIILVELEILILDLIELNLSIKTIKRLNYKILYDLIQKIIAHFLVEFHFNDYPIILIKGQQYSYLQIILVEYKWLLESLLIYLIFGSMYIDNDAFVFDAQYTPIKHVAILLENLVIQVSNLVIFTILENLKSLSNIAIFLKNNKLCNVTCISIRSLAVFRNSLVCQNWIYLYIIQPKYIYSSRYKVWLISSKGLVTKYIYAYRLDDFIALSRPKLILVTLIELQDLIIPKLEKFLLIFIKLILYIFINVLGNGIVIFIRMIMLGIDNWLK